MHCHANARLTPRGRAEVFEAVEAGMTVSAACLAFRVSRRFYYRWLPRWRAGGRDAGLSIAAPGRTRSPSGSRCSPGGRTSWPCAGDRLGRRPDRCPARAAGLDRPSRPAPARPDRRRRGAVEPIVRYEHARARRPGPSRHQEARPHRGRTRAPGHGRPARSPAGCRLGGPPRGARRRHPPRLRELLPDEKARTTARFLVRALRWFRSQGVAVRRLLTDNGSAYRSRIFGRIARRLRHPHSRTRPYRPQTNGKVERWIRTVLSECLYLEVFGSLRRAPLGARPVRGLLQRRAPSPGHRWTDSPAAPQREAGGLTVSPTSRGTTPRLDT